MTHAMLPPEPCPPEGLSGRLLAEWTRLYAPGRALVLSFGREAAWGDVALVWAAAQDEWRWPAAAIAIDGRQGYQLWWSLDAAAPFGQRAQVMQRLLDTLLPQALVADRVPVVREVCQAWPGPASMPSAVPALQPSGEVWSAFVARDLAPVFEGSPWLDLPPSPEGQADLLTRLARIEPRAFEAVLARSPGAEGVVDSPRPGAVDSRVDASHAASAGTPSLTDTQARDAARLFLLTVMQDPQLPMAQRIEAAAVLYRRGDALGTNHG